MSDRYPGGIISKTAPVPSGPYANSTAPGVWTLDQQSYWQAQGNWPTFGSVNPNAFIENLFQTWLYTGTGSTQTITNGINFSSNGGMVWTKSRSAVRSNNIVDTVRGGDKMMYTDSSGTEFSLSGLGYAPFTFSTTGFVESNAPVNAQSGATFASWSFRKQSKFFDIQTWTGDGVNGRTITHNLGTTPAVVLIKRTDSSGNWVWNDTYGNALWLNTTDASGIPTLTGGYSSGYTGTTFGLYEYAGNGIQNINASGGTYVAYIFASNAGGFGLSGTDNVISYGSYTGNGSSTGPTITLGYEPQYVLIKRISGGTGNWTVIDSMRGMVFNGADAYLRPNTTDAEVSTDVLSPYPTGFQITSVNSNWNVSGSDFIYLAIRRPMAVPTLGTQVFNTNLEATTTTPLTLTTGFVVDLSINTLKNSGQSNYVLDRLRGSTTTTATYLLTNTTGAQTTYSGAGVGFDNNTGIVDNSWWNNTGAVYWNFSRRSGFFDIVVLNSSQNTYNNSLGTAPNMIWVKCTDAGGANWVVYHDGLSDPNNQYLRLNTTGGYSGFTSAWAVSSSTFTVASGLWANGTVGIAYLFATCPGVSKVGSYTGTGATQTINCGFTTGARFVLIKRTDSTGDWWMWDSARGMISGTDPRIPLNSATAETNTDWVYTTTAGFQIVTTDASVNASGGSYVFYAVA